MKLMLLCASVASTAVALCIAGQITISIRPDANKTSIYLCMYMQTHIVYSASSLPDAAANKYLLHYTPDQSQAMKATRNIINKISDSYQRIPHRLGN